MKHPIHAPAATLECRNLRVRYGSIQALAGVSLAVPRGAVYALLGRNGAGKTSLVRCLLGHQRPDAGDCLLFGADAWGTRASAMLRIGVIPEVPDVPPAMTSAQAGGFCRDLYPTWDQPGFAARLRQFGIPPQHPFSHLSRGQQTQVCLALALGSRPELLVLDDPTLGLDAVARRDLYRELLDDMAERGTTILVTTHDLAGIEGIATHVGILQDGLMLLDEELESLKLRFRRIRCDQLPDAAMAALRPLHIQASALGREAIVGQFSEAGLASAGLPAEAALAMSLEDIFITLAEAGVEVAS